MLKEFLSKIFIPQLSLTTIEGLPESFSNLDMGKEGDGKLIKNEEGAKIKIPHGGRQGIRLGEHWLNVYDETRRGHKNIAGYARVQLYSNEYFRVREDSQTNDGKPGKMIKDTNVRIIYHGKKDVQL